jgi:hypothetical protein
MPNDGIFPKIKSVDELTVEDIPKLVKQKNFALLEELSKLRIQGLETPLSNALIASLYDNTEASDNLMELIFSRLTRN